MTETATDAAGAATATTAAAAPATGTTAANPAETGAAPAAATDWQAEAEKWKAIARQNEARAKANADGALVAETRAQKELLAKIAAKVGLAEETPDPAAITAKLEASQREARSRALELAVLRTAGRVEADGDALLDSRTFMARLDGVDPADSDAVKAVIVAAVAESPARYGKNTAGASTAAASAASAGQPAAQRRASTAGEFNAQPGGQRQWTKADIDRATPAQVSKAMADGLLDAFLAS